MNNTYQLTIRGIDKRTKELLKRKAAQEGVSLNKLAYKSLRQTAGTDSSEERFKNMMAVIAKYRIPHEEIVAAEEAIAWMDKASKAKQKRDLRDLSL